MKFTNLVPSDVDLVAKDLYSEIDEEYKQYSKSFKKTRTDKSDINDKRNKKRHPRRSEHMFYNQLDQ